MNQILYKNNLGNRKIPQNSPNNPSRIIRKHSPQEIQVII